MTENELQEVVAAVIASLKTNGRTIMQLTEATSVTDSDYFEINGGRRIAYSHLYNNVLSETADIIDTYTTQISTQLNEKIDGYNADWIFTEAYRTEANFNAFVQAISDDKIIYFKNDRRVIDAVYNPLESCIYIQYYSFSPSVVECTLTLSNGTVTLSSNVVTLLASESEITSLTSRMTSAETSISSVTGSSGAWNVGYQNDDDPDFSSVTNVATALDLLVYRLKEVFLTQAEYNALVEAGTIDANTKYYIYED